MKFRLKKALPSYALSIVLALTLAAGVSFAWNAVWNGTDWAVSGKSISPQNLAENFRYLYERIPDPQTSGGNRCLNGDILVYDKSTQKFNCLSCSGSETSGVKFGSNGAQCAKSSSMCRIWYRISSTAGWSEWKKTPWARFGPDNGWVEGPQAANIRSSASPTAVQMKMECNNAPSTQKLVYKINIDQWNGININDINTVAGTSTAISDGISIGSVATSRTVVTPNNAAFAAKIESGGINACHIQYRIAGDDTHWSYWEYDGNIAFTGTASGSTNLSYMNNTVLQLRLCCGNNCII